MIKINKEDDGTLSISLVMGEGMNNSMTAFGTIHCLEIRCSKDKCPFNRNSTCIRYDQTLKEQRQFISSKLPIKKN